MKTRLILFGVVLVGAFCVQGVEFTLAYKRLLFTEAQACPGGNGMHGSIQKSLHSLVKSEPKAASAFALYGAFYQRDGKRMAFRLDESKGDRKGFDQLIIDLNQNGDLTDDALINRWGSENWSLRPNIDQAVFGPIEAPADQMVGPWRPVFYAEMMIYGRIYGSRPGNDYPYGNLRCLTGWLLETTVEINGVKEKIAFKDSNCNFRLGDPPTVSKLMQRSDDPGRWSLSVEDYVLRDHNRSGQFENGPILAESEGLSSVIYFGTQPFNLVLSKDFKSIRLEPFSGALGKLKVNDEVVGLVLAREVASGKWEPLTPKLLDGMGDLPHGNYRLITGVLSGKDAQGVRVAGQTDEVAEGIFKIEAGKTTVLKCGLPIELKVACTKQTRGQAGAQGGLMGAVLSLFGGGSARPSLTLQMTISMVGAGGEQYSRFFKAPSNQPGNWSMVATPKFRILDATGKGVANGSFEFG